MTRDDLHVAPQRELHAPEGATATSVESTNDSSSSSTTASTMQRPSALSAIPRLFTSSSLRRPSKIPRLAKQPSSVSSTTLGDLATVESYASIGSKKTAHGTAMSTTSAVSSRETTPFSSPSRSSSSLRRLREPKQLVGRKRARDETTSVTSVTSVTISSVAERLAHVHKHRQEHSEDLSTVTTQDDTASQVSTMYPDDGSEMEVMMESQSSVASVHEVGEAPKLEQQVTVARALQRELLRDRARLRLKISSMKDDVETYYELLARMEQVTVAVMARHAEEKNIENSEAVLRLVERIQSIISARKTDREGEEEMKSGDAGTEQEGSCVEASPRIAPPSEDLEDAPHEEVEEC